MRFNLTPQNPVHTVTYNAGDGSGSINAGDVNIIRASANYLKKLADCTFPY